MFRAGLSLLSIAPILLWQLANPHALAAIAVQLLLLPLLPLLNLPLQLLFFQSVEKVAPLNFYPHFALEAAVSLLNAEFPVLLALIHLKVSAPQQLYC